MAKAVLGYLLVIVAIVVLFEVTGPGGSDLLPRGVQVTGRTEFERVEPVGGPRGLSTRS